jgi:hypothetical protein
VRRLFSCGIPHEFSESGSLAFRIFFSYPLYPNPYILIKEAVHLLIDSAQWLTCASLLQPGIPAAPGINYLPLLPFGPDGVHSAPPRRTQPSTLLNANKSHQTGASKQEFNPAKADFRYRAPLAPHLARPH